MTALSLVTIFIATLIQRITGMGFALCAAPILVLVYGPHEGVLVVTVVALFASVVLIAMRYRDVDWRRTWWLLLTGVAAAPLGALLTWVAEPASLLLFIGIAAVVALAAGLFSRIARAFAGTRGAVIAGSTAGVLHVSCGLSGPPLALFATNDRWSQPSFVASVQVVFIALGGVTLALRGFPRLESVDYAFMFGVVIIGLMLGSILVRRVPESLARRLMMVIAWSGAIAVLVRGIAMAVDGAS